MSLKSWKEEFYPITASAANRKRGRTVGDLIEHCLQKWRGAREENLAKHGLCRRETVFLHDAMGGSQTFAFDYRTCALCKRFDSVHRDCTGCPLFIGGKRCYSPGRGYDIFTDGGGPELMIRELEGALEKWRKENEQS